MTPNGLALLASIGAFLVFGLVLAIALVPWIAQIAASLPR